MDTVLDKLTLDLANVAAAWRARVELSRGPVDDDELVELLRCAIGSVQQDPLPPPRASETNVVDLAERRLYAKGHAVTASTDDKTRLDVITQMFIPTQFLERLLVTVDGDMERLGKEIVRRGLLALEGDLPDE